MTVVRWLLAILFIILFTWIAVGNLWISLRWYLRGKRETLLPFLGGILGLVGMLLVPIAGISRFCWIPLVVDLGCGPMLCGLFIDGMKRLRENKRQKRENSSHGRENNETR